MTLITDLGEIMRAIGFAFLLCCFFVVAPLVAMKGGGELMPYGEWQKMATAGDDGEYYVLVSADWCQPCTRLKDRLRSEKYSGFKFGIVDYDRSPTMRDKLMRDFGFKTIPTLIRYRKADGKWQKPELWDGADLDEFLGIEVKDNEVSRALAGTVFAFSFFATMLFCCWTGR